MDEDLAALVDLVLEETLVDGNGTAFLSGGVDDDPVLGLVALLFIRLILS